MLNEAHTRSIEDTTAKPSGVDLSRDDSTFKEYWELTKPRLSMLSVITAIVGYLSANPDRNVSTLMALLIGTSLAAGSAGALNQWLEREVDKRMARTRARPIPSGAVSPSAALIYGLALGFVGVSLIWFGANPLAALLTISTLFSYLLVYTPLKQRSQWNTIVGAIPGAIPPLIGCAAASGTIDPLGWILFGILFCWQIPHFMAIAWTYRRDYDEGGFVMSTVVDPTGRSAAIQSVFHAAALLVISVLPSFLGYTSYYLYLPIAAAFGAYYLWHSFKFMYAEKKDKPARGLFFASIFYLPLILAALVVDRWILA